MIVGKLYRKLDELDDLLKNIEDDLLVTEKMNDFNTEAENRWLVVKVEDLSCRNFAYGIVLFSETLYSIKNILYSEKSETLVDCCIRMLVSEGFDKNYEAVIAEIDTYDVKLQEIFSTIGFMKEREREGSIEMKVTEESFMKHKCN